MEIKIGMGANEIMFCTMKGNMKIDQIVNFSSINLDYLYKKTA